MSGAGGGDGVGPGGDVGEGVGALRVRQDVAVGHALAVEQLYGGVGQGVGPVGHGAVDRGGGGDGGAEAEVDVGLLHALYIEALAVIEFEKISDLGHCCISSSGYGWFRFRFCCRSGYQAADAAGDEVAKLRQGGRCRV